MTGVREKPLPQPAFGDPPLLADPPSSTLLAAARRGALRGALLLVGEEGIGKKRLALEMFRAMTCPEGETKGACGVCRRILGGAHPDVTLLVPEGRVIKVDSAREVINDALKRPFEAPRRVVIVDGADRLHPSAANALLKTLEEPPSFLLFLLVTSRPEHVLATIRSRAPAHHVPTLPVGRAEAYLRELGWPGTEIERAMPLCGGRIGFALRGGHRALEGWPDRILDAFSEALEPRGARALLALAEDLAAEEDDFDEVIGLTARLLRDLRVVRDDAEGERVVHRGHYGRLAELAPRVSAAAANRLALGFLRVPGRLTINPNVRLMLEALLTSVPLAAPGGGLAPRT